MRKTQKIAIVGGTVGVLMAGGIAYAAWTSEGNGSGTATAGHEVDLTVAGGDAVGSLYPTLSLTVPVTVKNNNTYPVHLTDITYNATGSSSDAGAGCTASNIEVSDPFSGDEVLAAGATSASHDATVTMIADAASDCQDATFTINFDASAHS
jgi:hypothetical protein